MAKNRNRGNPAIITSLLWYQHNVVKQKNRRKRKFEDSVFYDLRSIHDAAKGSKSGKCRSKGGQAKTELRIYVRMLTLLFSFLVEEPVSQFNI